jgi:biopolymer transport protein ExbD
MAGISFVEGHGGRRALDSEVNMIPMIDLFVVTIAFLLLTAVWVRMQRLEASARVPQAGGEPCTKDCHERELHLDMTNTSSFVLAWREGKVESKRREIPRDERVIDLKGHRLVTFTGLEAALREEWEQEGAHRDPTDTRFDHLVIHTDDTSPFAAIVGAMDAAHGVQRPIGAGSQATNVPALTVTFATR